MWKDKRVIDLSREEAQEALAVMIQRERDYFSDEARKARAQVNIDLLRRPA